MHACNKEFPLLSGWIFGEHSLLALALQNFPGELGRSWAEMVNSDESEGQSTMSFPMRLIFCCCSASVQLRPKPCRFGLLGLDQMPWSQTAFFFLLLWAGSVTYYDRFSRGLFPKRRGFYAGIIKLSPRCVVLNCDKSERCQWLS